MKANLYKIVNKPKYVNVVESVGVTYENVRGLFNYRVPLSIHSNKVYFLAGKDSLVDKKLVMRTEEVQDLPTSVQYSLLNQAIEKAFLSKGLYKVRRKKTIYVTQKRPLGSLKVEKNRAETVDVYVHDALEYQIEDKVGNDFISLLPSIVITNNGVDSFPEFTQQYHSNISDRRKYNNLLQIMDRWISTLDKSISVTFDNGEKLEIILEELNIENNETHLYPEPQVSFHQSGDMSHIWPYMGLKQYHPLDYNLGISKGKIKVALIGTGMSFELLKQINNGVGYYKGFNEVFKSTLEMGDSRRYRLEVEELKQCSTIEEAKNIYMQALQKLLDRGVEFDVLLVELPNEISHLFDYQTMDIRDYLKVAFLEKRIPTQFITPRAVSSTDTYKYMDLALGIYVSAGGIPWKLEKQPIDTCFIGISFGIRKTQTDSKILVGIAEIFDELGESISIKCVSDNYEDEKGYHISTEKFEDLIRNLLQDYYKSYKQFPRQVVVHKTSEFIKEELDVIDKLKDFPINFTLVYVGNTNIRLFPDNKQMPKRGDFWMVNKNISIIYTDGFVDSAKMYLGIGAPSPLLIKSYTNHIPLQNLSEQMLQLTKLNWNSTKNHERLPVTLSHSYKIVDLLRAGLEPSAIISDFRFYR